MPNFFVVSTVRPAGFLDCAGFCSYSGLCEKGSELATPEPVGGLLLANFEN
jgi:hypothetical protein